MVPWGCTAGRHFQPHIIKMIDSHSACMELYPVIFTQKNLPLKSVGFLGWGLAIEYAPFSKGNGIKEKSQQLCFTIKSLKIYCTKLRKFCVWFGKPITYYCSCEHCIFSKSSVPSNSSYFIKVDILWTFALGNK